MTTRSRAHARQERRAPVGERGAPADIVPRDDHSERLARQVSRTVAAGGAMPVGCLCCASGMPCASHDATPRRAAALPLEGHVRRDMEGRLGADLSAIRIDTGARAAADSVTLGARAFTRGGDIAFGADRYQPSSSAGRALIAHELVHAIAAPRDGRLRLDADPSLSAERVATTSGEFGDSFGAADANQWLQANGDQLAGELKSLLSTVTFVLPVPELSIDAAGFVNGLFDLLGNDALNLSFNLARVLAPDSLSDAVDMGRDVYPIGRGPAAWAPGVVPEIGRRLIRRVGESIDRIAARFARWKARQPVAPTPAPAPTVSPDVLIVGGPVRMPADLRFTFVGPLSNIGGPDLAPLAELSFDAPIDSYVFAALSTSAQLDVATWTLTHLGDAFSPGTADQRLRKVTFEWQVAMQAPTWLRVTDPPDATRAEVAYELYGDSAMGYRLVAAPPLWGLPYADTPAGVAERRVQTEMTSPTGGLRYSGLLAVSMFGLSSQLRPEYAQSLLDALQQQGYDPSNIGSKDGPLPEILASPLGDEAALRSAGRIVPTKDATAAVVTERLALIHDRFGDMIPLAISLMRPPDAPKTEIIFYNDTGKIDVHPYVAPASKASADRLRTARARVDARWTRIGALSPEDVLLWDRQTHGQLDILNATTNGLGVAAFLSAQYGDWPHLYDVVSDIADGYVSAAEVSDLYDPASAILASAEQKSKLFPATVLEVLLTTFRETLRQVHKKKLTSVQVDPGSTYEVDYMDQQERDLRARLAVVREKLLSDPDSAKADIKKLFDDVMDLQTGVTIGADLDAADAMWQQLLDSTSVIGEIRSWWPWGRHGDDLIRDGIHATNDMSKAWFDIMMEWRYGDRAKARQMVKDQQPIFKKHLEDMRSLMKDQASWNALFMFAAMVGIALLSGGLGTFAEGFAGAAWGAEVGAVVGVGTDAIAFSAMSYPLTLTGKNTGSVGGFLEYLGTNFLFMGLGRGIASGYQELIGAGKALTIGGKVGQFATMFVFMDGVALMQANEESKRVNGRSLTAEEATAISLQTAAFLGATALGGKLLESPLKSLKLEGTYRGREYSYTKSLDRLKATLDVVATVEKPDDALKQRLFADQDAALDAERKLASFLKGIVDEAYKKPEAERDQRLKSFGISKPVAEALRGNTYDSAVNAHVAAMEGIRVQKALEPVGRGDFAITSDLYEKAIGYFASLPDTQVIASGELIYIGPAVDDPTVVSPMRDWANADPEMIPGTGRSFVVSSDGKTFRVFERAPEARGAIAGTVETTPEATVASPTDRTSRLRRIADALSRSRAEITNMDPAGRKADRDAVIYGVREPPGAQGAPEFEGYVYRNSLIENQQAIAEVRAKVKAANPDVIVGMERGGAFLVDVLGAGDAELAARKSKLVVPQNPERATNPKASKFAENSLAPFRDLLGDPANPKVKRVAIVDAYMGGTTASSLRDDVLKPLAKEYKDVEFDVFWLRENLGKERVTSAGLELEPQQGIVKPGQQNAARIRTQTTNVTLVLGDDMNLVLGGASHDPIRIFDDAGQVVDTFSPRPGQTTRDLLIDLMNGVDPNPLPTAPPPATPYRMPGLVPPAPLLKAVDPNRDRK